LADYLIGTPSARRRIGILPSAFNPPTIAHLALAAAAEQSAQLDQVVFALPRNLPHKSFAGASLDQRIEMVQAAIKAKPARAAALTTGGLFIDIAREFRQLCEPITEIFLVCGKDAAERFARWDYGTGASLDEQLEEFTLLVGDRFGRYEPPTVQHDRILLVPLPLDMSRVSSQALRALRAQDEDWRPLTVDGVAQLIEEWALYQQPDR